MKDLSALTPPLLVCAVVVIAIVAFLRHEMGRSRPDQTDQADIAADPQARVANPDNEPTGDRSSSKIGDG